jgi:hypothetical protein
MSNSGKNVPEMGESVFDAYAKIKCKDTSKVLDAFRRITKLQEKHAEEIKVAKEKANAMMAEAEADARPGLEEELSKLELARNLNMAEVHARLAEIPNVRVTSILDLAAGSQNYNSWCKESGYYGYANPKDEAGPMTQATRLNRQQEVLKDESITNLEYVPQIRAEEIGGHEQYVQVMNHHDGYTGHRVKMTPELRKMLSDNPELLINPPAELTFTPVSVRPEVRSLSTDTCGCSHTAQDAVPLRDIVSKIVEEMYMENYQKIVHEAQTTKPVGANDKSLLGDLKKRHFRLPMQLQPSKGWEM